MSDTSKAPDKPITARDLRRARARRAVLRLALGVGLPTVLACVYYGAIATDLFESQALFSVQSADGGMGSGIESLMGIVPGAGSSRDALSVRDYILSRDMLDQLVKEQGFIEHFTKPGVDYLTRLERDATSEDRYEYFIRRVQVEFDSQSGVLTLSVKAFDAASAKRFAAAILRSSEHLVNELSRRAREDKIQFTQAELDKAEERLAEVRKKILALQNQVDELNPVASANESLGIRASLEGEVAKTQAELRQARGFMAPDAPKVIALQQRVSSLLAQISKEKRKVIDDDDKGLNNSIADFEEAMLEKEFAEKRLVTAQSAFEIATMEALRQHRYLAVVSSPSEPNDATHPRRLLGIATVFIAIFLSFGVLSMLVAAVKEHAKL
ncbi:MAG: hypothetical protein MUC50_04605 [Myxococcota bacterium]|jgi:capsular polysaccharide transport system permease protein|nr:hypothetical protein [Myxococcota bacterium]